MHFPTILSIAALLPVGMAGCFKGGAPFPNDHAAVIKAIRQAAHHYHKKSPLHRGEHHVKHIVQDKVLRFVLDNISSGDREIDFDAALDGFTKEYAGCHNGGDTSYTNWRYV